MFELPPIPRGSEREQLAALRDYLVRLARSLETETARSAEESLAPALSRVPAAAAEAARSENEGLRALIVKTADTIRHSVERLSALLREDYLALSEFGTYREQLEARLEATARGVVESYDFVSDLQNLDFRQTSTESLLSTLHGEIRRGLIADPETGETAMGIAVAETLRFTGAERTENGLSYYELSPGQTLGLYTATGWQFWINGSKRGWFDAVDGRLHVGHLAVEQSLSLGPDWLLTVSGGLGLRCLSS